MNYHILTLFPQMVLDGLNASIIGRAVEKQLVSVEAANIRDFSKDKRKHVDDAPYSGDAGVVMQLGPVYDAHGNLCARLGWRLGVLYVIPQGKVFNQEMASRLAMEEDLVLLCDCYEGIDERALEMIATGYPSVDDYVLTGGELPVMMVIDCTSRPVPGAPNNDGSAEIEPFYDSPLGYPQYTRPEVYEGRAVLEVLSSGHHKNIHEWWRRESVRRTLGR